MLETHKIKPTSSKVLWGVSTISGITWGISTGIATYYNLIAPADNRAPSWFRLLVHQAPEEWHQIIYLSLTIAIGAVSFAQSLWGIEGRAIREPLATEEEKGPLLSEGSEDESETNSLKEGLKYLAIFLFIAIDFIRTSNGLYASFDQFAHLVGIATNVWAINAAVLTAAAGLSYFFLSSENKEMFDEIVKPEKDYYLSAFRPIKDEKIRKPVMQVLAGLHAGFEDTLPTLVSIVTILHFAVRSHIFNIISLASAAMLLLPFEYGVYMVTLLFEGVHGSEHIHEYYSQSDEESVKAGSLEDSVEFAEGSETNRQFLYCALDKAIPLFHANNCAFPMLLFAPILGEVPAIALYVGALLYNAYINRITEAHEGQGKLANSWEADGTQKTASWSEFWNTAKSEKQWARTIDGVVSCLPCCGAPGTA